MAYQTGFVDNSVKLASHAFLDVIYTLAVANSWVAVRDARTGDNPELILKGPGNLDYQDVYIGFRGYHSVGGDYYNLEVAGFNGYVPEATFANQPMALDENGDRFTATVPLHNLRVDYWLCINDLRILFGAKVGSPIYGSVYAGLYLLYGTPSQNTYPLFVGANFYAAPARRFSETPLADPTDPLAYDMAFRGNTMNCQLRTSDNLWVVPEIWPWNNTYVGPVPGAGTLTTMRDSGGYYPLFPAVLNHPTYGLFGELDGVFHIPGFGNATENTLVIDTKNYLVLQALGQTGFNDYFAMRLD